MTRLPALVGLLVLLAAPPIAAQTRDAVDVDELMVPGPLGEMALGNPSAPVTVIEYASMTCPHCQRFHAQTYPALKADYIDTDKVYFILREFPLDPLAYAAIMLARCAGPERFFPIVDTLFDRQEEWAFVENPATALASLLEPHGTSAANFDSCLANEEVFRGVAWVHGRAREEFGVGGTPTFFFNGMRVEGEITTDIVDEILAPLLGE